MECRHYILSKYLSAKRFAQAMRNHCSIENRLHWQLDVSFQEDQCRIRKGNADANFSALRRTALSLLKNNHSKNSASSFSFRTEIRIAAIRHTTGNSRLIGGSSGAPSFHVFDHEFGRFAPLAR